MGSCASTPRPAQAPQQQQNAPKAPAVPASSQAPAPSDANKPSAAPAVAVAVAPSQAPDAVGIDPCAPGNKPKAQPAEPALAPKQEEVPPHRPFAFMRMTHEALRAGLKDCRDAAAKLHEEAAALEQLKAAFEALAAAIEIHARTEDTQMFPLLDRLFDGVASKELAKLHAVEFKEHEGIRAALAAASVPDLQRLVAEWADDHEKHLVAEEEIMTPLTEKIGRDWMERGAEVRKFLTARPADTEALLKFVAPRLAGQKLQLFASAIQGSSSASEYAGHLRTMKEAVAPAVWAALPKAPELEAPGKQPEEPPAAGAVAAAAPAPQAAAAAGAGEKKEEPPHRPFAFMRMTHEAVRAGLKECATAVGKLEGEGEGAEAALGELRAAYEAVTAAIAVHARTEDGQFFPLLDRLFEGVASSKLAHLHELEEREQAAVRAALAAQPLDAAELKRAVAQWLEDHEKHLTIEEEIMMPLTEKIGKDWMERGAEVRKFLTAYPADTEALLKYAAPRLAGQKLQLFASAIQGSSSPSEYAGHLRTMKEAVAPAVWAALPKAPELEAPGKQPEEPPAAA
eukprot:tig00021234_g19402.t1